MSAGRMYTVQFHNVSVTNVQDLLAAYAGSSMAIELVSFNIGQITQTSVEAVQISVKRLPGSVTTGSGGTAPTPVPDTDTDAAATFTARVNDTTQATTAGTVVYPMPDVFNEVNGYQWIWPERARPSCKPTEALIVSLDSAPAAARTMSGSLKVREMF